VDNGNEIAAAVEAAGDGEQEEDLRKIGFDHLIGHSTYLLRPHSPLPLPLPSLGPLLDDNHKSWDGNLGNRYSSDSTVHACLLPLRMLPPLHDLPPGSHSFLIPSQYHQLAPVPAAASARHKISFWTENPSSALASSRRASSSLQEEEWEGGGDKENYFKSGPPNLFAR
jgi:hypothetical protein